MEVCLIWYFYLAILVFDATRPETLEMLNNWLRDLQLNNVSRQCTLSVPYHIVVTLFVACNKIDLNRNINKQRIEDYANSIGAQVFYTSAKDGTGVMELFTEMSNSIVKRHSDTAVVAAQNYGVSMNDSITIPPNGNTPEQKKKWCW